LIQSEFFAFNQPPQWLYISIGKPPVEVEQVVSMAKRKQSKKIKQAETESDDSFYSDTAGNPDLDYQFLDTNLKDKKRSRIRRRMKARRELERRQDEKNLKTLIDDEWLLDHAP